jgi:ribosomal protein L37E
MKEQMIMCPRCGGNACHEASNEKLTVWSCFGCGFTSNSTIVEGNLQEVESVVPQLYLDLKFKDTNGYYWYPNTVILEDKSMVFADGKTTEDWKWAGVQSKDGNADMTTIKHFEEKDFMEALDYIGFFEKQK